MTPHLPVWRQVERAAARSLKPRPTIARRCNRCGDDFHAETKFIRTCPTCKASKARRHFAATHAVLRSCDWLVPAALAATMMLADNAIGAELQARPVRQPAPETAIELARENIATWQAAATSRTLTVEICANGLCHALGNGMARLMVNVAIEVERGALDDLRRKAQSASAQR